MEFEKELKCPCCWKKRTWCREQRCRGSTQTAAQTHRHTAQLLQRKGTAKLPSVKNAGLQLEVKHFQAPEFQAEGGCECSNWKEKQQLKAGWEKSARMGAAKTRSCCMKGFLCRTSNSSSHLSPFPPLLDLYCIHLKLLVLSKFEQVLGDLNFISKFPIPS